MRPGWFQASPIGPRLLSPQKLLLLGPIFQESLVNRNMAVRVLVRLISPRTFSSLQFVGTPKDFVKLVPAHGLGLVGSGYDWRINCAAGLSRFVGITFAVGKGAPPLAGSVSPPVGKPLKPPGQAEMSLKSPPFSATVGTRALLVVPEICLFHS